MSASLQKIVVAIVVLTSFVASIFVVVACLLYCTYRYLYSHSEDERLLGFHLRPNKDMVSLENQSGGKLSKDVFFFLANWSDGLCYTRSQPSPCH